MANTFDDYFAERVEALSAIERQIAHNPENPYLMREYVNASNSLLFAVMRRVELLEIAKGEEPPAEERPGEVTVATMQRIIGGWSNKTFPQSTIDSTLRHLWAEMVELDRAFTSGKDDDCREEVADLFILLVQLCNRATIDLQQAVRQKHAINVGRAWQAPDQHGVVYHQKESN